MEFRSSQEDGNGSIPASLNYSPPPIRPSAFSKPASSSRNGLGLSPPTPAAADPNPSPISISSSPGGTAPFSRTPPEANASGGPSKYRECLKNHAASIGGHVVDGCGEFMPSDDDTYKCAACACHRSFHRKDSVAAAHRPSYYRPGPSSPHRPLLLPPPPPPPQAYLHHQKQLASPAAYGGISMSGGTTTESSSEEQMDAVDAAATATQPSPMGATQPSPMGALTRKRFRTKFTAEQKEKMLGFAERAGWRLQRQDEAAIEQLCREIGVRRQVFKVWMHNNKHSIRKQQLMLQQQPHHQPHEQLELEQLHLQQQELQ